MVYITSICYSSPLRRQMPLDIPGASVLSELGEKGNWVASDGLQYVIEL